MALPVKGSFEQASKTEIANLTAAKAANAKFIFHPYYKISYDLKIMRLDPARGRHSISDTGTYVVDGLDGDIINRNQSTSSRLLNTLKSTEAKTQNKEQRHIVTDLLTIQPEANYKFKDTREHYAIVKVRPDISFRTAIKTVVNEVIHENSKDVRYTRRVSRDRVVRKKMAIVPYHDEVLVKKASLIYVPMWEMDIETNRIDYSRRVLASSGTIILDSIALCPRHLSIASAKLVKKQTYAVCEVCGVALCKDHISNVDNRFYCDKDNPSNPTGNKETDKISSLKKGFTRLLKRNKASLAK